MRHRTEAVRPRLHSTRLHLGFAGRRTRLVDCAMSEPRGPLDSAAPLHTEQPHERRERGSRPLMLPDSLGSRTHDAPERLPSGGEAAVRAARHPTRPFAPRGDPQANPRPAPPDISPFTKLEKPRGAKTAGNFRFGPTSSPSSSRAVTAPWATMRKPRNPATASSEYRNRRDRRRRLARARSILCAGK